MLPRFATQVNATSLDAPLFHAGFVGSGKRGMIRAPTTTGADVERRKTSQRVLAAIRQEQPATLAALMKHLGDVPKQTVRSSLQNMRYAGLVKVENNGRASTWMLADANPQAPQRPPKRPPKHQLSDWTKKRLAENTVEGEGDCLIWCGHVADSGAPVIYYQSKRLSLRRLIWRELHGREPHGKMVASSTCGTHGCCNPAHVALFSRTALQNQAIADGRRPSGEAWSAKMALVRQSRSKIGWEMVRRIRACGSLMEAVRMSGLPKGNVAQIYFRKTWRNDPQDVWSSVFMRLAA